MPYECELCTFPVEQQPLLKSKYAVLHYGRTCWMGGASLFPTAPDKNKSQIYEHLSLSDRFPQVVELKTKLAATEVLHTLEKEQMRSLIKGNRQDAAPEEKERESLNEELQELKKENKLLKERDVLTNKKKEHYECEIKRLNKALQDALKIQSSSLSEDSGMCKGACNHAEMRTEVEVLKQQLQIYEEDFKNERSDRERLNQEKEELQKINQTSQSLLDRLNSQIKACQMEKEELGKQLKQMCLPTCNCGLVFHLRDPWVPKDHPPMQHLRQHLPDYRWHAPEQLPLHGQRKAHGFTSEKKVNQ